MHYHLTINRLLRKSQNIPFTTSEKFFDNEHDVINWIIDNQLSRRNITEDQRAYLIGKRYKEEKKQARPKIEINVGTVHTLPDEGKRTVQKIAEKEYHR
jgi:hypothetical protein